MTDMKTSFPLLCLFTRDSLSVTKNVDLTFHVKNRVIPSMAHISYQTLDGYITVNHWLIVNYALLTKLVAVLIITLVHRLYIHAADP